MPMRMPIDGIASWEERSASDLLDGQRGPDGLLGVVLAHGLRSPDAHDGVADVLVDAPVALGDHPVDPVPQLVEGVAQVLRIQSPRRGW